MVIACWSIVAKDDSTRRVEILILVMSGHVEYELFGKSYMSSAFKDIQITSRTSLRLLRKVTIFVLFRNQALRRA